jgi:hypothetical protein
MKQIFQIICVLVAINTILFAQNRKINRDDIVIVLLTGNDINKSFATEEEALTNRALFAHQMTTFIQYARKHAKFLVIDNFFQKYVKTDSDDLIVGALKQNKNVTLPAVQFIPNKNIHLRTPPEFLDSVPLAGHGIGYRADPPTGQKTPLKYYYIPGFFCDRDSGDFFVLENCNKKDLRKHTAIIAAEGFLGEEINAPLDIAYWLPLETLENFQTYTTKEFEKDKTLIHKKIVIYQKRALPTVDVLKRSDGSCISGAEILANLILIFSQDFPPP